MSDPHGYELVRKYQHALEERRTAREAQRLAAEAIRMAHELVENAERAVDESWKELSVWMEADSDS